MNKAVCVCPSCDVEVAVPEWNPYDGVWECPYCYDDGIDRLIPVGPRDAEFRFTNQNPEI